MRKNYIRFICLSSIGNVFVIRGDDECSALIKQDTLIMEYNPHIEVLNDKTNKQKLHSRDKKKGDKKKGHP